MIVETVWRGHVVSRIKTAGKFGVYTLATAALTLSYFVDYYQRTNNGSAKFWIALAVANFALWCSWPRYRSLLERLLAFTLTLIVVGNFVLSPLVWALKWQPSPTLPANLADHVRIVGMPGMSGEQTITTDGRGYRTNSPIDYER